MDMGLGLGRLGLLTPDQCSPFHVSSPLQPVIAQLEFAAGLNAEDDDSTRLGKLEALLATLLGIPLSDRYAQPQLTSDILKRRTLQALVDQLAALARIKPVYWLVEDMHWVDPTTKELVGLCLDRIRDLRVFALLTFRPEFTPAWVHMPHVTGLTLNRLARRQCLELVENLCGGKVLPREATDQIVEKTDGIPLFIETSCGKGLSDCLLARARLTAWPIRSALNAMP